MYKSKDGSNIYQYRIVKDKFDRYWFVEEFTHKMGEEPRAKCRNGCAYTSWEVKELEGVYS
ncbi:hypothetical protein [Vibrio phage JSF2]|uniref:Uncharacterized protein ORF67 n=1 Tax=Vibrio phage ICP1 TaxID=979525 RepID=F1D189_9CAUD|nr:hypothetical protein ViPhICP1_gp067 [Vibrio phage ICP1]ADX87883.1 hypothetical protein [Vibrio phage ICP1]ASV41655.1 hypothetical protein [Vibrio phage JSF1]ASV42023.1 hypothetical protein [Vibrio phage JSF2]